MLRRIVVAAGVAALGLALVGCTGAEPGAGATDVADVTSPSPTESGPLGPVVGPTATPTAVPGVVPTKCASTMTAATYAKTFASTPLNDPNVVGDHIAKPTSALASAITADGPSIYCAWRDPRADVSGLILRIDTVDPAMAKADLAALAASGRGYKCSPDAEGTLCQQLSTDPEYAVDVADTYYLQGGIAIEIYQANVPTDGLMNEVMRVVWP